MLSYEVNLQVQSVLNGHLPSMAPMAPILGHIIHLIHTPYQHLCHTQHTKSAGLHWTIEPLLGGGYWGERICCQEQRRIGASGSIVYSGSRSIWEGDHLRQAGGGSIPTNGAWS